MDILYELKTTRAQLIREIDLSFEQLLQRVSNELEQNEIVSVANSKESYEIVYSLLSGPTIFKGKKPTGVIFEDGRRVDVRTWKKVVEEILHQCNSDQNRHMELLNLRGKVSGRERVLLAKTKENMRSPLKIDKWLYMETHYDTETLLRILMTRILDVVGYDYSGISIVVRNDRYKFSNNGY